MNYLSHCTDIELQSPPFVYSFIDKLPQPPLLLYTYLKLSVHNFKIILETIAENNLAVFLYNFSKTQRTFKSIFVTSPGLIISNPV